MRVVRFGILILALGAFAACKGGPSPGAGTAPSATTSPAKPVKSVAKIVAFGDSLTAGYGLSKEQSYPSRLQEKLAADGFDYEVVNAGISGDTSAGGARRSGWSVESGAVKS